MIVKYQPLNPLKYPRFCGPATFFHLPHVRILENVDFIIAGVPFDSSSVFKVGSRFGPQAVRNSSLTFGDYNMEQKVKVFSNLSGVDYGDLPVVPGRTKTAFEKIEKELVPVFKSGIIPILVGGDHSITLPHLRSCFKWLGADISLLHFDSHTDTWDNYLEEKYNHATQFRRAVEEGLVDATSSIQVGLRGSSYSPEDFDEIKKLGYDYITTSEVKKAGIERTAEIIKTRIGNKKVFLSFDIDFVDPAYAPGTGYPECGGFTSFETLELIRKLKGLDFVGFDVVEVLPSSDVSSITSLLAATIMYEFLSLIALQRH